jgi:hypothetical protein
MTPEHAQRTLKRYNRMMIGIGMPRIHRRTGLIDCSGRLLVTFVEQRNPATRVPCRDREVRWMARKRRIGAGVAARSKVQAPQASRQRSWLAAVVNRADSRSPNRGGRLSWR